MDFYYLPTTTVTYSPGNVTTILGTGASNDWIDITSGGQVNGRGIIIQWESTDQIVLNWLSSQTMSNSTGIPKSVPPPALSTHHGISSGAIAGIALGAVAGLALLILGVWLFLRRRKRSQPNNQQDFPEHVHADPIVPEKGKFPPTAALSP